MLKSINYLFVFLVIMDLPLVTIFGLNGVHVIAEMLMFVTTFLHVSDKKFIRIITSTPVVLWLLWIIYSLINWRFSPGPRSTDLGNPLYMLHYILTPLFTMLISYYEGSRDLKQFLTFCIVVMSAYVVIGVTMQGGGAVASDERTGTSLGNELALTSCVLAFVSFLSFSKKYIKTPLFLFVNFLVLVGIFFISTRKAMGGWFVIVFFYLVGYYNLKDPKKIIGFGIALAVIGLGAMYILQNTFMGERMMDIENSSAKWMENDSNLFLRYMGDRAYFYIYGWALFLQYPWTGIGLENFGFYMIRDERIHSEYIVELCENGVIGSLLYLIFNISIIKSIVKSFKIQPRIVSFVCVGGMACIIFISFYAWTYSVSKYFIMMGIILSVCMPTLYKKQSLKF